MGINYLRIEFGSKKNLKIGTGRSLYDFSGSIYYIFNNEGFISQTFTQIKNGCEYRTNDQDMQKTDYWKNQKFIQLRKKILPFTEKPEIRTLTNEQTKIINEELKNLDLFTTHLKLNEFLTGSNTSGSETNLRNTPMLINGLNKYNTEFNFYRFLNFFKKITLGKNLRTNFSFDELDDKFELTIDEYLNKFPNFKTEFLKYNYDISFVPFDIIGDGNDSLAEEDYIFEIEENYQKMNKFFRENKIDDSYYKEGLSILRRTYEIQEISKEKLKLKLRNIFSLRVDLFTNSIAVKNYIKNSSFPIVEKAHIVPFSYLVESQNDWDSATSPYNCLMLEPNLHKAFDFNEIFFSNEGKVVYRKSSKSEMIEEQYGALMLREEIISNDKIMKFIELSNKLNKRI
ncbi:MAG4270 family putative restriction endonuclease [Mesoplasma florum]|uniref:MAG4270 family putative restriction endonuclease n=1 Tax=Mesoplasma florum TaxID=2151 RepID=UPI000BE23B67|nr:HNH endonuclease signature motif containing protein [Mesoplasma florum]ATI73272.1 hypothetical protein CQZ69_01685 [Mesoplasma florum]AVN61674.1 hypothetical protein CG004_01685 [Mesoplasma florum]